MSNMRLTGLMSGMDTESIVSQLVEARRTKVTAAIKEQKALQFKQDAWKELNSKIVKLYNGSLGNMRFESSFIKKTTKVSDSSVVSVITGEGAMNSVQSLEVKELAKSGYLTGAEISAKSKDENGNEVIAEATADTKLSELMGLAEGEALNGKINVTVGGETKEIEVTADTTISSFVKSLQEAGVNANFDETNQRIFVSSKGSGLANDFTITAGEGADGVLTAFGLEGTGSHKENGADAKITLNGVEFTSSKNSFEINGLTLTVTSTTDPGEVVTITTEDDTDGIYDMVKDFIKEYNALINEMDKLYNADAADGYEPLTDEEKEAMSESEVEKWETKIKDAVLRKDSSLSTISSAMKQIMMSGVEVNGKKMYLSDFGIETLSYFVAPENEKNAYHIAGDPDDENTSGNADKLKSMIANDPETVVDFFTELSKTLYGKMTDLMRATDYSSSYTAYDDKKMKEDYDDYTSKIAELEDELADYEDSWYAKFAAMETAMAKMQQNASAVTSLLGGGY